MPRAARLAPGCPVNGGVHGNCSSRGVRTDRFDPAPQGRFVEPTRALSAYIREVEHKLEPTPPGLPGSGARPRTRPTTRMHASNQALPLAKPASTSLA